MNTTIAPTVPYEDSRCDVLSELSIALISPNEKRRIAAAESACAFCEFSSYLATPADRAKLSQLRYDVIMVDVDGDTDSAVKLVESLSSGNTARVFVYSSEPTPEKLTRCIHAGARDFFAFPFQREAVVEALTRFPEPRMALR